MFDLNRINVLKENNQLEAKLAAGGLPKSVWETYSAFANTAGGVILIGVEETADHSLRVVGLNDPEGYIADFWNTINNRSKVNINILAERHVCVKESGGKKIVVIEVPRADRYYRPVYINNDIFNGTFRRNGEGDYHCTAEEVKSMLRDQADVTQDVRPILTLSAEMIDADSLKRYRNRFLQSKPGHVWNGLEDNDFLEKIGAVRLGEDEKPHPTGAGILVFGNEYDIVKEFPHYFLDYREKNAHGDTGDRWIDRVTSSSGDWSGNLFDFYFRVIDRLTKDIKTPFSLRNGLDRVDETDVHTAVREALANALIHADYYGRRGVVVEKAGDYITISNPGDIRVSVEEAFSGGISDPRNACIFKLFSLIGIGERAGSGLYNIKTVWERHNWHRPELRQEYSPGRTSLTMVFNVASATQDCDKITGEAKDEVINEDKNEVINSKGDVINLQTEDITAIGEVINQKNSSENPSSEVIKPRIRTLSKRSAAARERKTIIIDLLTHDPHISISQMVSASNIPKSTVERILSALRQNGVVVRVGSKKNGRWLVNGSFSDMSDDAEKVE
ncbi:MAG: putative DNA binding domain-containing protein [bacterium]|nr:putative DNA binding domain-containing protein [bacterium]